MPVLATPKKFVMQQVFELLLRRPVDKSIVGYLTDVKTTGLENTMEMVYPTGGRGNVYIGAGFAHSRRATFNIESATFNMEILAIQNGTEVYNGSTDITYYDEIDSDDSGEFHTRFTAQGAVGSEIGWLYVINEDGSYGKSFQQEQVAGLGKFAYAASTKLITFDTSDPDKPTSFNRLACAYTFKSANNAERITIESDGVPPVVLVTAYGLARDVCSGELFPAVIEGQAQIDGNWNFDLSADGDPAVQNLSMEFVKGCASNEMYTFTVFTEDEYEGE